MSTGDHHHHHHHHHDSPETNSHVHGGAMVLDIGGSVGALHVTLDEEWVGREVFLGSADPAFRTHTGVWLRHADDGHVATALFPGLEAGTYHVLGADGERLGTVAVAGAEVADVDLRVAVGAAPGDMAR